MSDLLIHVGYPKTATTTLQEALFSYLNSQGHINYLGITVKADPHFNSFYDLFSGYMASIPFGASITSDVLNYQLVQDAKRELSLNCSIQPFEKYFHSTMLMSYLTKSY